MAGFFPTAGAMTAAGFIGAAIAFVPAVFVMSAGIEPAAGKTPFLNAQVTLQSAISSSGGTVVSVDRFFDLAPYTVEPAIGATVSYTPGALALLPAALEVMGGGWASLVTDSEIVHLEPTSRFATTKDITVVQYTVKVENAMNIVCQMSPGGGLEAHFNGLMDMTFNTHGPVARSKRVSVQVIMS